MCIFGRYELDLRQFHFYFFVRSEPGAPDVCRYSTKGIIILIRERTSISFTSRYEKLCEKPVCFFRTANRIERCRKVEMTDTCTGASQLTWGEVSGGRVVVGVEQTRRIIYMCIEQSRHTDIQNLSIDIISPI